MRRSRRPIINASKGQATPLPPGLVRRPVIEPRVYWTWSLVWRRGQERAAVLAAVDAPPAEPATWESTRRTPGCPTAIRTSSSYPAPWQAGARLPAGHASSGHRSPSIGAPQSATPGGRDSRHEAAPRVWSNRKPSTRRDREADGPQHDITVPSEVPMRPERGRRTGLRTGRWCGSRAGRGPGYLPGCSRARPAALGRDGRDQDQPPR